MRRMISGIYIILNTKNGKVYIGQAQDFRKRRNTHFSALRGGNHKNPHLQAAFDKYGEAAFEFKRLEYCPVDQLDEREQHYLDLYTGKVGCYNIATNAKVPRRGLLHNAETRYKLSEARKRRAPPSAETRKKLSEANRGRVMSLETRNKISESKKNPSEETRRRLSQGRKGKRHTEETRLKLSLAGKNISEETRQKKRDAQIGKSHTEETRQKLSAITKNMSEETRRKRCESQKRRREREKLRQAEIETPR